MSADNGVYILQCKDQYRVGHFQAIENLYYTYENGNHQELYDVVPTRVIEYYGGCKYTRNRDTALRIAHSMLTRLPVCEYGIQLITVNKTWKQIIHEAKRIAVDEITYMESQCEFNDYYKYAIERLKNALEVVKPKSKAECKGDHCCMCGHWVPKEDGACYNCGCGKAS